MTFFRRIDELLKLRLDDKGTEFILGRAHIFSRVSPNIITLAGFVLNFGIYYLVISDQFWSAALALVFRYFADCLDGGVARKYNKKSKVGGLLDTISDAALIYLSVLSLFIIYKLPGGYYASVFIVAAHLYVIYKLESLIDHAGIKGYGSLANTIYAFFVNNSFILFGMYIIMIYYSRLA